MPSVDVGLFGVLGFQLDSAETDRVVLHVDVGPQHHQPFGYVHGGVHCALVESAASIGAALSSPEGLYALGVANRTNFLRSFHEGRLTATAIPINEGEHVQLWQVEVRDDEDRLVSCGEVHLQLVAARR